MSSARVTVPPIGPAWFPAAMGTGILATLLQLGSSHLPALHPLAVAVLVLAWTLLLTLTLGFVLRAARDRAVWHTSVREPAHVPMWGTVAMGILAVGSATATVVPATWPQLASGAVAVDASMWVVGTAIGLITAFGFTGMLLRRDCGAPSTVWGLAVVGPMVSATTGAALVPPVDSAFGSTAGVALLLTAAGCFMVSLVLGLAVFSVAYHHHWRVEPVALAASCSTWIPLGMVGQSTAAAQSLASRAATYVTPEAGSAVHAVANGYGGVMLAAAVPLVGWAVTVTARGFLRRMPFTPGWWALTFPVGTLALGAADLGAGLGSPTLTAVSLLLTGVLCGSVALCIAATAGHVRATWRRPARRLGLRVAALPAADAVVCRGQAGALSP